MSIPLNLVFEDALSEFTMTQIVAAFGNKYYIGITYNGNGYGYIKKNINGFNQAAIATPFFVLTDLDNYKCPSLLITDWLKRDKNPNFIFRIAIREIESWIIADIEGFSKFLGISHSHFPYSPELESDPKRTLIKLASKSRKKAIREDIVPINDNAKIGPNYNGRLMEFVLDSWSVARAMEKSDSLSRAYKYLEKFTYTTPK